MPEQPTVLIAPRWHLVNGASDEIVNVFAFSKIGSDDPFTAGDMFQAINQVGTIWSDTIGHWVCDDCECVGVSARAAGPGASFNVDISPTEGTWANIEPGEAMKPWECVLVNHGSTAPGRSGVGRTYLAGVRDSYLNNDGQIQTAFRGNLAAAFNDWREQLTDPELEMPLDFVVYSRTLDEVASVIGSGVRPLVAIQRDRRAGSA